MTITSRDDFGDDICLKITPQITHRGDCAAFFFLPPLSCLVGLAGQGASSFSESRISPLLRFLNSQHHPYSGKKSIA
jgi:hypothetical protein